MKFEINKDLFPVESRFVLLEGGHKIHYVDVGRGPVLLMLHGNPSWSFLYRYLIQELKEQFRCIAPDLPGFGLSEAAAGYSFRAVSHYQVLEQFIHTLQLDSFVLIAQDWGGPLGLRLAENYPDKLLGAVLGNTWAWPLKGIPRYQLFSWLNGGPVGRWAANNFNGVWKLFMHRGFNSQPTKQELEMYRAPFLSRENRKQTSIFPRELIQAKDFLQTVERDIQKIQDLPVLFCWGSRDFAFRQDALTRLKLLFPTHQTVLLEAGHFWQHDKGIEASAVIKEWYKSVVMHQGVKKILHDVVYTSNNRL